MRVNLLTFHWALNYGAVLQAYALSRALASMGHDVRIIDLRSPWMWSEKEPFSIGLRLKRWKFMRFMKHYLPPFTRTYRDPADLKKDLPLGDAFIVGSDQVWNPSITRTFIFEYFLEFVPDGIRKISYAASFGTDKIELSEEKRARVALLLNQFSAISVREHSGVLLCKEIAGVSAVHVLDPVFLLPDYSSFHLESRIKKDTLVCYKFDQDAPFGETVDIMSKVLKMPACVLDSPRTKNLRTVGNPKPEKWVANLWQSSFVFTDSFHGLAFALMFRKNFIVMPANPKRFGRIEELLKDLELEGRIFRNYGEIIDDRRWQKPIDYKRVSKILSERIQSSKDFLSKALSV